MGPRLLRRSDGLLTDARVDHLVLGRQLRRDDRADDLGKLADQLGQVLEVVDGDRRQSVFFATLGRILRIKSGLSV